VSVDEPNLSTEYDVCSFYMVIELFFLRPRPHRQKKSIRSCTERIIFMRNFIARLPYIILHVQTSREKLLNVQALHVIARRRL